MWVPSSFLFLHVNGRWSQRQRVYCAYCAKPKSRVRVHAILSLKVYAWIMACWTPPAYNVGVATINNINKRKYTIMLGRNWPKKKKLKENLNLIFTIYFDVVIFCVNFRILVKLEVMSSECHHVKTEHLKLNLHFIHLYLIVSRPCIGIVIDIVPLIYFNFFIFILMHTFEFLT